jgi:hypothetical protein
MDVPEDLSGLLQAMAIDFPAILRGNLVGIYLWRSLTYNAFDETCSDVGRSDRRAFAIDREFLDRKSRCCGFYH